MRSRSNGLGTIAAVVACLVVTAACDKEENLGTQLELVSVGFEVDAGLNPVLAHTYVIPDLSTEHARFSAQTGREWDSWSRVSPWRATLVIQEPGLTWGFAQEISIQAYSEDFAARREIFYRDQIQPDAGARLDLIPSDADARDLFAGERVSVVVEFRRLLTSPPQRIPAVLTWSLNARE